MAQPGEAWAAGAGVRAGAGHAWSRGRKERPQQSTQGTRRLWEVTRQAPCDPTFTSGSEVWQNGPRELLKATGR